MSTRGARIGRPPRTDWATLLRAARQLAGRLRSAGFADDDGVDAAEAALDIAITAWAGPAGPGIGPHPVQKAVARRTARGCGGGSDTSAPTSGVQDPGPDQPAVPGPRQSDDDDN